MQGTIRQVDLKDFIGMPVIKVAVSEYGISLYFKQNRQLDITTHWELFDSKANACIDRGVGIKLREQLFIYKLIGKRLLSAEKFLNSRDLVFDGDLKLTIHMGKIL